MSIQKSHQETNESTLCQTCNTFYGSKSTNWLCSSCYKKGKKQQKEEVTSEPAKLQEKIAITEPIKEQKKQELVAEQKQKDRKRCFACQKKVGLLGTQCKCKFVFCNSHRLPQDHKCEFNFKELGHKELQKTILKVDHGRIQKI